MLRRLVMVTCALPVVPIPAAAVAAGPAIVPGWPVASPPGSVHPGPGGVVVVDEGRPQRPAVVAYRPGGGRLWVNTRDLGCGNCDDGPQVPRFWPDGTLGPVGAEGDDTWAVDARGREVAACTGVVLRDGTCIAVAFDGADEADPQVTALRAGTELWRHGEATFRITPDGFVPPLVVADLTRTAYVAYPDGFVRGAGAATPAPARMLFLDTATGRVRFTRTGRFTVLAGLTDGVVVRQGARVTAWRSGGGLLWSTPVAGDVTPASTVVDRGATRVYVGASAAGRSRVLALDAATGAILWTSPPGRRVRPLAATAGGGLLAASTGPSGSSLTAHDPAGRVLWVHPVATPVAGAAPLPDGTVAVTTEGPRGSRLGLVTRIAPRVILRPGRAVTARLDRSVVRSACVGPCERDHGAGAVLALSVPRPATVRVGVVRGDGRADPRLRARAVRLRVPAGTVHLRVLVGRDAAGPGLRRVVVDARVAGRAVRLSLPVRVR